MQGGIARASHGFLGSVGCSVTMPAGPAVGTTAKGVLRQPRRPPCLWWLATRTPILVSRFELLNPLPPEGGGFDGRLKAPEDLADDFGNQSVTLKVASSWGTAP